jgi:hypothetical protein
MSSPGRSLRRRATRRATEGLRKAARQQGRVECRHNGGEADCPELCWYVYGERLVASSAGSPEVTGQ